MPHTPSHEIELCGICQKEVKDNQRALACDECDKWTHTTCNNISVKQYVHYQNNVNEPSECKNCSKCNICSGTVAINHHGIKCVICSKLVHLKCNKLDKKDYVSYQTQEIDFFCINCTADTLPFLKLDNNQFELTAKGINVLEEMNMNETRHNQKNK